MGNTVNPPHPLPQIWERINSSYLRHRLTQEIIEEHTVVLPSEEEQLAVIATLKKRIALHHMSIAKVIYFKHLEEKSICSQLQSTYEVVIYTEYTGDTLERVVEEKGERIYHIPCQCTHILSASEYLKEHNGCFELTPSMVFLGNRKQKNTKLWVNSRVELSERQFPSDEDGMCESLCRVLKYLKNNKICVSVTDEQLETAQRIKRLSELKAFVFEAHRGKQQQIRHKKSNSALFNQAKAEDSKSSLLDKAEANKKLHNNKANSLPQKNEQMKIQPKGLELLHLTGLDESNQIFSKLNSHQINNNYSSRSQQKNPSTDIFYRPTQISNPLKINFLYPKQESSNRSEAPKPTEPYPQRKDVSLQLPLNRLGEPSNRQTLNTRRSIKDGVEVNSTLFSPHIGTLVQSVSNSPDAAKLLQNPGNFTAREMELPLPEAEEKITPARLPTTSRSPKIAKEAEIKPAQEAPQVIHNRYQRKIMSQSEKSNKLKKPLSINTSGSKFQKYKDAIKSYEQKLRKKLATSLGGSNPLKNKNKGNLVVRKAASSSKNGEFKQTKSLYNDSDDESPAINQVNNYKIQQQSDLNVQRFASYNCQTDQSIPENEVEQKMQSSERKLEVGSRNEEAANKKLRERLQKLELQRQLEKEKVMIQIEMQDLLKQNAMRDEYRSIREKIKQKKQTFAQLKAEATKILQDLEY